MSGQASIDPKNISYAEQLKCANREVLMRQRVYPRWVANGKMKQETAEREIAAMQAIARTLVELVGLGAEVERQELRRGLGMGGAA